MTDADGAPASVYELADLYDAQYRHYRDDLHFYRRLADDHGGPVLELGCGSGRVTAALAQQGVEVVALDREAAMLARAEARLQRAGVAERVTLQQGDMRELERADALGDGFALVLAPFNTLMHAYTLDEQDATLRGARARLRPGGGFACDLFVPDFGALGVVRQEAEWDAVGGGRGELFLWQRHDPARQLIESRYHLDTVDADGFVRRQRAVLRQRYYTRFELERALRAAGFRNVRLFGDFDRRAFAADARVMVALARR